MKLSTINRLSKAIALPLFITILNTVTPAGAEQIDRSRSNLINPLPAATDLNLVVPVSGGVLPPKDTEPSNSIEPFWSNPNQNSPSTTDKEQTDKAKSISRPKGRLATARVLQDITNINSITVSINGQSHQTKSIARRKNLVATSSSLALEATARDTQKTKSLPSQRIATGSRPPLSGNYLRLVRDPNKGTNNIGNPIYILEAYVNGQRYQTFNAVSGTATTQNADRHLGSNFAPLPDGLYAVNNTITPGTIPEVGRTFIGIYPKFETGRNALGIHLDRSFNRSNGYDGTAGCIGITTLADRDAVNKFVTKYHPHNLFVSIASSEE